MSQLRDKENGCEWDKEQTFDFTKQGTQVA